MRVKVRFGEPEKRTEQREEQAPEPSASLESMRTAGMEFLEAADSAIRQALSGDPETFLRSNRQQGGQ